MWFFIKEFSYFFLYYWYMGLIVNEDYVVDIRYGQVSVLQCDFQWFDRMVYQIFNQVFQFCMSYFDVYVFWIGGICGNVWQVYVGLLCRRQFDFGFFCGFFQVLYGQWIVMQVNVLIFFKFVNEVVDQVGIEVFIIQVGIIVGCQNFKGFFVINFVDFDNRDIESIIIEVVNCDSMVVDFFIQIVSQCCGSWFVDYMFNFQFCDMISIFGSLMLCIVKVSWYGDNCFSYWFVQIIFSCFFYFFQYFGRNLWWCYFLIFYIKLCVVVVGVDDFVWYDRNVMLNFFVLEVVVNQVFNCKQGVLWVCYCLMFSWLINQSFIILGISNDRRCSVIVFGVFQYVCLCFIYNCYIRVGSIQVDINNFIYLNVFIKNLVIMWL